MKKIICKIFGHKKTSYDLKTGSIYDNWDICPRCGASEWIDCITDKYDLWYYRAGIFWRPINWIKFKILDYNHKRYINKIIEKDDLPF